MSFCKCYPNRKDWRKEAYGSKSFDASCRNHGSCGRCTGTRLHCARKRLSVADEKVKENR